MGLDIAHGIIWLGGIALLVARFSKTDWLDLGLELLVSDRAGVIRIDKLCAHAARTKGSFYHHFKDRDAFVSELMTYWEDQMTQKVIDKTQRIQDPIGRILTLNKLASGLDAELERALRRWAGSEPLVEAGVARVDKRRVEYLARLWQDAKDITSQQAIDLAVMDYATMVGFQQFYVDVSHERRARIDKYYGQLMESLPDRA
ncbi:MAG: TetR/AcrR family transcriptional regulator [Hyphomonadaceae bacterium]|nr:TetR/AcrR family transcriptional regulator [Hyphomonadaceae bacterium]